jgi:hypothetical protein
MVYALVQLLANHHYSVLNIDHLPANMGGFLFNTLLVQLFLFAMHAGCC